MTTPKLAAITSVLMLSMQLAGTPGVAATSDGAFAVRGIGAQSCSKLTEALASPDAPAIRQTLAAWMAGWLSHANRQTEDSFDVYPIQDLQASAQIIGMLCKNNPDAMLDTVIASVVTAMTDPDGTPTSELITVEANGKKASLRAAVLKRAQEQLVELELLEEDMADGTFGPASQAAFTAFQKNNKLTETGLPDVATLYVLLQAK